MSEYPYRPRVERVKIDNDFQNGMLFEVIVEEVQKNPTPTTRSLGSAATREGKTYSDARMAAAGDDTGAENKPGAPIIEQSPTYTTEKGRTFTSVPGPVPVVKFSSAP